MVKIIAEELTDEELRVLRYALEHEYMRRLDRKLSIEERYAHGLLPVPTECEMSALEHRGQLEAVEALRQRTGVSVSEAKFALNKAYI